MTKSLSIIIVAYHSDEVLMPCLRSLSQSNPIAQQLDVVIVDNLPESDLGNLIANETYSFHVQYIHSETNLGFGGGNNLGVQHALSPWLLFLNPDTLVYEDVITPTLAQLQQNPNLVIGYSLTDPQGQRNDTYSFFPEYVYVFPLLHLLQRISFLGTVNRLPFVNRIAWPWGAAFALSREKFLMAGGFDEHIFLCNEEPDLMRRLPDRRILILPQHIIHLEGHGKEVPVKRYLAFLESTDYYLQKYRIPSRNFYWMWVGLKLKIRQWLHIPHDKNYREAFHMFQKRIKHQDTSLSSRHTPQK